jgi:hypothetical protein
MEVTDLRGPRDWEGRNMDMTVPLLFAVAELLKLITPSCFAMMPCMTHSPSPVPFSNFVVKNGSKIRS